MYIGSQTLMKRYDEYLLKKGYTIEMLVDKASDCLLKHMLSYQHIALLCGPGNNGADGLSLALKLFAQGKNVDVYIFDNENGLSQANQYYLDLCYQQLLHVIKIHEDNLDSLIAAMQQADVIVDAMFGFGLNSSPRGLYQAVIEQINQFYDKEIIAVDIPTGLDCNTGNPYQSVISATQTITLSALKNGFLNPDSCYFTGQVIVEVLDVEDIFDEVGLYQLVNSDYIRPLLKTRRFDGHKGDYGHIGLITGSLEYKGASLLSAKSAVYSGTGITTVITCQEVIDSLTVFCPEATAILRPPVFRKEDFDKYDSVLIGCGLGLSIDAYRYVIDVLSLSTQNLVLDADALTILSSNLDLLKKQDRSIVLTPHMGEFKRLCDYKEDDDILEIASSFAKEYQVILVLKGPYTLVTDGEISCRIASGNSAMSTGGMGDVLAGMITSFLGQGYHPLNAAMLGVFIHGYTGDRIAENAYTVIPSLLIERIPQSMKEIMKKSNS
ncbi:MAG: NAD(P)H-hydrate dehydratase, partial [Coprobacillus sp.]